MAGEEVRSIAVKQPPTPGPDGGFLVTLDEQIPLTGSTWLALRCFEPTGGGRNRFGHTAPWHVDVPGHPLRPRHVEIDYLVGRMESEIKRHTGVLPEAALAEYRKALAIYQEIARTAR
ncbi:MAG: hypothetical protein K8T25_07310 [Planctomycetia bacterium]|nr:hypothetical protein [Planctomycetia bacterium]